MSTVTIVYPRPSQNTGGGNLQTLSVPDGVQIHGLGGPLVAGNGKILTIGTDIGFDEADRLIAAGHTYTP